MICLNNQEIQTNFHGLNDVVKVYAGENLVLGQDIQVITKTATANLTVSDLGGSQGNKLQTTIENGNVTLLSSGTIRNVSGFIGFSNSSNTLSFTGINNISKVEVVFDWKNIPAVYAPTNGSSVNVGQITHDTTNSKSFWNFDGSTGAITFNNQNSGAYVKYTGFTKITITVYYTD